MASILEAPRPQAARGDDFVEKRIREARARVRTLDLFTSGLIVFAGSMILFIAWLLVDRYVETPPGTGWAALGGGVVLAGVYVWWALCRPSRRHINPYYAARQVELTIPDAKNSVVNYVDLQDDEKVPESIKTAVATRAARDLKTVDLNRAIERKQILWLGALAGLACAAAFIIYLLPPTRTQLTLIQPKGGDVTVFSGQDLSFQVRVDGRVPTAGDADATRLRIWYNVADPTNYEDRPMAAAQDDRRAWGLTIPAKQMRAGFQYQVLSGNAQTPKYTVTYKIIPEFFGYEVRYEYPDYTKRSPETTENPNIVANFGTKVTLTAHTNRDVATGFIQIDGQQKTIEGMPLEEKPQSIQFTFPLERDGSYSIWFTTVEGDRNTSPPKFRMTLLDPKPAFHRFDVAYVYPEYLRFKPQTVRGVANPEIEGARGTRVTLTAHATRPVKEAKLQIEGVEKPVVAERIKGSPASVRFTLPMLDKDTAALVSFTPTTPENPSEPKRIPIRVSPDAKPQVEIEKTDPLPGPRDGQNLNQLIEQGRADEIQLPANASLGIEGFATDDHGVDKLTLRMEVTQPAGQKQFLAPKPYRGGKSFRREADKSYPTRVEYKDTFDLSKLMSEKNQPFAAREGMLIEFWLEAVDNCNVPPGPNVGISKRWKLRVLAPENDKQKQQEQQKKDDQRKEEQKKHEDQQDKKNEQENREPNQPPPPGQDKQDQPKEPNDQPKEGEPKEDQPKDGKKEQPKDGKNDQSKDGKNDQPKEGEPKGKPDPKNQAGGKKDGQDAQQDPKNAGEPKKNEGGDGKEGEKKEADAGGKGEPKEGKSDPKDQQAQRDAEKVRDALNKENEANKAQDKPGGQPPPNGEREDPAKPKPEGGGMGNNEQPAEQKPQPNNPEGGGNAGADKKNEPAKENPQQPQPPKSEPKPSGGDPGMKDQQVADNKPNPMGNAMGQEGDNKPMGKEPDPKGMNGGNDPKEKDPGKDKGSGNQKRPEGGAEPKKGPNEPMPKNDPAEEAKKVAAGEQKPPESKQPMGGNNSATSEDKGGGKPDANQTASSKPKETIDPGKTKPQPKNNETKSDTAESGQPKPGNDPGDPKKAQAAADKPADGNKTGKKNDESQIAKGGEKPDPNQLPQEGGTPDGEKLDPEAIKKLAQDLKNADPKAREKAQEKLNEIAADKEKRAEAQKKLEELLNKATDQEKKDFAEAMKELADASKKNDNGGAPKKGPDPKDGNAQASNTKPPPKGEPNDVVKNPPPKTNDTPAGGTKPGTKDPMEKVDPATVKKGPGDGEGTPKKDPNKGTEVAKNDPNGPKKKGEGTEPGKGPNGAEGDPKEPSKKEPAKTDVAKGEPKEGKAKKDADPSKELAKGKGEDSKGDKAKLDVGGKREGQGTGAEAGDPELADARHKLKAGELQLEHFKKNQDRIKPAMKWDDAEMKKFLQSQEDSLKRQRENVAAMEKKAAENLRSGASGVQGTAETLKVEPTIKGDTIRGGRYTAPPGFGDSFKQFTEELNNVRKKE